MRDRERNPRRRRRAERGHLEVRRQVPPGVVAGERTGHAANGADERADGDRLVRRRAGGGRAQGAHEDPGAERARCETARRAIGSLSKTSSPHANSVKTQAVAGAAMRARLVWRRSGQPSCAAHATMATGVIERRPADTPSRNPRRRDHARSIDPVRRDTQPDVTGTSTDSSPSFRCRSKTLTIPRPQPLPTPRRIRAEPLGDTNVECPG